MLSFLAGKSRRCEIGKRLSMTLMPLGRCIVLQLHHCHVQSFCLIVKAFQIFDANSDMHQRPGPHIERIAQCLKLDPAQLKAQWLDVFPRVRACALGGGSGNIDLWQRIMAQMAKPWMACHPTNILRKTLAAYVCFVASTSGVEQHFSKAATTIKTQRWSMLQSTEEVAVKLLLDLPDHHISKLVPRAIEIFKHAYQGPLQQQRCEDSNRVDKGVKRKAVSACTEAHFIRKRRMGAALAAINGAATDTDIIRGDDWCHTHDKELTFQKCKAHGKAIDALAENALLKHEVTPGLQHDLDQKQAKRVADHAARGRKAVRMQAALKGSTGSSVLKLLNGKRVFVDINCRTSDVARAMWRHCLTSSSKHQADAFIVPTPGKVDDLICAASALRGAYQISAGLLTSDGRVGVALKFHRTSHLPKTVYISPAFLARHRQFCDFLQLLIHNIASCKWKLHTDGWPALKASEKAGQLFALLRSGELAAFGGHKNTFHLHGLLNKVCHLDSAGSVSGV